jgi:hypothetical protein
VGSLTSANRMFLGAKLSTTNYDALLIGWNAQTLQSDVEFHGGNSTYCAGEIARTNMISLDNWEIMDGGKNCATLFSVIYGANTIPSNGATLTDGPNQISIEFNMDAKSGGGTDAADYPGNYLLVEAGVNGSFDTYSCSIPGGGNAAADDTKITINNASYDGSNPFITTLNINGGVPLPTGKYRLFVCGTTSVENLAGDELNEGVFDSTLDFTIRAIPEALPTTGFPPGQTTVLQQQTAENAYSSYELWMEIPRLGVKMDILGVPVMNGKWDVTWLGSNAGWLEGTAFPTYAGNTGITAHVWDTNNNPGPLVNLKELLYDDVVKIHAWGYVYTYSVRHNYLTTPLNTTPLRHEEYDWVTILTCERFNPANQDYQFRRVVRAVLVNVSPKNHSTTAY